MHQTLEQLIAGRSLSRQEAHAAMSRIMAGECGDAEIAGFLVALRMKGETGDELAGCAAAMRERVTPIPVSELDPVDTCGTGGDGAHTFNISTAAALVAAGAGARVAKHGNRAASSRCGSADVLAALGVNIDADADVVAACIRRVGIGFLFAPRLHPAMKHAMAARRALGVRTIFNLLGPLTNPAGARRGVLGVFSPAAQELVAAAARGLGMRRLFVVHSQDGLDEISICAPTRVLEIRESACHTYELAPERFGLALATRDSLRGGQPQENAQLLQRILEGAPGPSRDVVLLNAAAAILAADLAPGWPDALAAAARSIDTGAAAAKLAQLVRESHAPAGPPA